MKQLSTLVVLLIAISGVLSAQTFLSCEASPKTLVAGGTVNLSIESSAPASLLSGCGLVSVHQGSPTGPVVYSPFICPGIFITVFPGLPYANAGWPTSAMDTPGDYFIKILGNDVATGAPLECFCPVRIIDPMNPIAPILTTSGPVNQGDPAGVVLSIASPGTPNAPYILAASLTTNVGLTLSATQHLALDDDVLLGLSLPVPNPILFTNFQGSLDGSGSATGAMMVVPASPPSLLGWPIAFQGAVISASFADGFHLTNAVAHVIN